MAGTNSGGASAELRRYGRIWLPLQGVLLGGVFWWWIDWPAAVVAWSMSGVLAFCGWMRPALLRLVFRLHQFGARCGALVVTLAVLALVFFTILTPIAVMMRWLGWNGLRRRANSQTPSYWETPLQAENAARYFQQF